MIYKHEHSTTVFLHISNDTISRDVGVYYIENLILSFYVLYKFFLYVESLYEKKYFYNEDMHKDSYGNHSHSTRKMQFMMIKILFFIMIICHIQMPILMIVIVD